MPWPANPFSSIGRVARAVVLLLWVLRQPAPAQTVLVIADQGTQVRELRTVSVRRGVQTLQIGQLPPGIDLSTLMVRTKRMPMDLQEWARSDEAAPPPAAGDGVLVWKPVRAAPRAASVPQAPVSIEARFAVPDERQALEIELLYRTSGLRWSAAYQVVVRGDRVEEREPLSADLTGWIRLENRSGITFSNASVRLVGRQRPEGEGKPPGFLLMDESNPLTDLWRWRPPEPEVQYEYNLARPVHLVSGADVEYRLVQSQRIPVRRRYVLQAEEFSASLDAPPQPLRKFILVDNTAAHRLGIPLPPGPVQLFVGSMRSQLLQTGGLPHTPVDGEIRIDLGPSPEVMGRRGWKSRTPLAEGGHAETFGLEVHNNRDGAITVEVDEKPPLILYWTLLRSTKACREVFRRLKFEFDVPAGARETVEYSVRVRRPSL